MTILSFSMRRDGKSLGQMVRDEVGVVGGVAGSSSAAGPSGRQSRETVAAERFPGDLSVIRRRCPP
jgi:hypothetical protein